VGRASALLGLALFVALIAWYLVAPHLGAVSRWWAVAIIAFVLMPALFGLSWVALPLWNHRRILYAAVVLALVAIVLTAVGQHLSAHFAKFAAMTAIGWVFLAYFEALSWVVLVALIIPWVDAYSVWRGPTKAITDHHAGVFTKLSVAFVVPGGNAAQLGLPDVLFFSVFLAASARFELRKLATWFCMTASVGITVALASLWNTGLPALPGIALGFLLPNADLIWTRVRRTTPTPGADPQAVG
jgi:hypothetical protein